MLNSRNVSLGEMLFPVNFAAGLIVLCCTWMNGRWILLFPEEGMNKLSSDVLCGWFLSGFQSQRDCHSLSKVFLDCFMQGAPSQLRSILEPSSQYMMINFCLPVCCLSAP